MNKISVFLFAFLGLAATATQAVVVYSNTSERVTARNCDTTGPSVCEIGPILASAYGGLPGSLASSVNSNFAGYGSASGSAALSGAAGAPILRGSATSQSGKRTSSNTYALQQYTYNGSTTTRTFSGTLTYSQTMTGDYSAVGGGGVYAQLDIFKLSGGFEAGATLESNFDAMFNPSTQAGYGSLGSLVFNDPFSNPNGQETFGVTVTLNPGDVFFVWAALQTPAPNGSLVDASGTFVTRWDDSTNLVPAAVAATPEPATFALLGLGLAGLGFARRRRAS